MSKVKKARKEEAIKRAKRKKIIIISACVFVVAAATAAIIIFSQGPGGFNDFSGVIDLTRMSSTMAHSVVSDINENPYANIGKTIIARGLYTPVQDTATQRTFHNILVEGTDGCCRQSLQFILNNTLDYPPENSPIHITGVFASADRFGGTDYFVSVDEILY